jgi:hypothetical protein
MMAYDDLWDGCTSTQNLQWEDPQCMTDPWLLDWCHNLGKQTDINEWAANRFVLGADCKNTNATASRKPFDENALI